MITNAFRRSGEGLADKQSEQSAEQSADEFNDDCWTGEQQQQAQSVFPSMDQTRAQIPEQMMSRDLSSRDAQATGFERLSPARLSPVQTSPIRSPIVRSPVLRSPILGQSLLQSSLLQSNLLASAQQQNIPGPTLSPPTLTSPTPDRPKNGMVSCLDFNFNQIEGNYITPPNRQNRTTNRSVCAICNKKFRNQIQLQFHIKKVSWKNEY